MSSLAIAVHHSHGCHVFILFLLCTCALQAGADIRHVFRLARDDGTRKENCPLISSLLLLQQCPDPLCAMLSFSYTQHLPHAS